MHRDAKEEEYLYIYFNALDSRFTFFYWYNLFKQTNDKGLPDHKKIIDGVMKNASGRELQNFVQKTMDDCFEEMEKGNIL